MQEVRTMGRNNFRDYEVGRKTHPPNTDVNRGNQIAQNGDPERLKANVVYFFKISLSPHKLFTTFYQLQILQTVKKRKENNYVR
jgi:hypothetical protein